MTKQEVLDYLDNVLHPIVSPDNWNVYSELYDMIEELPSAEPVRHDNPGGKSSVRTSSDPTAIKAQKAIQIREKLEALQELARHQMIVKLYADILRDMKVCEIEGWDRMEYINMLRRALNELPELRSGYER